MKQDATEPGFAYIHADDRLASILDILVRKAQSPGPLGLEKELIEVWMTMCQSKDTPVRVAVQPGIVPPFGLRRWAKRMMRSWSELDADPIEHSLMSSCVGVYIGPIRTRKICSLVGGKPFIMTALLPNLAKTVMELDCLSSAAAVPRIERLTGGLAYVYISNSRLPPFLGGYTPHFSERLCLLLSKVKGGWKSVVLLQVLDCPDRYLDTYMKTCILVESSP